jgi:hypothetical protein
MIHKLDRTMREPIMSGGLKSDGFYAWGLAQDMSCDLKLCDKLEKTIHNCYSPGNYPTTCLLFKSMTFQRVDSVSAIRWNLFRWAQ